MKAYSILILPLSLTPYPLSLIPLLLVSFTGFCQNSAEYKKGLELKNEYKFKESLDIFQSLLKNDSGNVALLDYVAVLSAKVTHDEQNTNKDAALKVYNKSEYLAKKSLKIDSNNAESYYAYAFAIGVLNEYATSKQQIANAGLMKHELDKCLALNPHHAGAHHLLGRWYRRLAEFNSVEKMAVKVIYGTSLPDATYQEAAEAFQKSVVYEPGYILHEYELALTYHKMGRDADAKVWLQTALQTNYAGDDAVALKAKCNALLKELK